MQEQTVQSSEVFWPEERFLKDAKKGFLMELGNRFPLELYLIEEGDGMVFFVYKHHGYTNYRVPERKVIEQLARQLGSYQVNESKKDYPEEGIEKHDILVRVFHSVDHRKMHIIGLHPAEPAVTISFPKGQITPYAAGKTINFVADYLSII